MIRSAIHARTEGGEDRNVLWIREGIREGFERKKRKKQTVRLKNKSRLNRNEGGNYISGRSLAWNR